MGLVTIEAVGKTCRGRSGAYEAMRDFSLALAEGEFFCLLGTLSRCAENMEGLRGKRVGVARGTGREAFWLSVVARLNLNAADYTIVNVEAPEMVAALEHGNIDAFAVWEPWPTRAARAIPSTRIPVANESIGIIRNFVYMNQAWAEANAETTTRFMRSMVEAPQFIAAQPGDAAGHVGRFLRQDRAFVAELMTKVEFTMRLTPDSVGNTQFAIDHLHGMNRLSRPVTPAGVIWSAPLARVAADRVSV